MKTWLKALIISLVFGLLAFALGPMIWPPSHDIVPTPDQLPFFMLLSLIEALVFGIGIAFIFFGWPLLRKLSAPLPKNLNIAVFISIAWTLVSWWPHDSMHIHNALNVAGLLVIDYSFHLTLIIASLIIAFGFYKMLSQK